MVVRRWLCVVLVVAAVGGKIRDLVLSAQGVAGVGSVGASAKCKAFALGLAVDLTQTQAPQTLARWAALSSRLVSLPVDSASRQVSCHSKELRLLFVALLVTVIPKQM